MVSCVGGGEPGTLGRCDRGVGGLSPSALRWPLLERTVGLPSVGVLGPAAPCLLPTLHPLFTVGVLDSRAPWPAPGAPGGCWKTFTRENHGKRSAADRFPRLLSRRIHAH
jgi:hypothetical protein